MRLIDAEAFDQAIAAEWERNEITNGEWMFIREVLKKQPTIERRRTARWIIGPGDLPECSACHYMTPYDRSIDDYERGNYCPYCGANMMEEAADESV